MLECKKCLSKFPISLLIDGKKRILNKRKYCLDCSPFKANNRIKLEVSLPVGVCKECSKSYTYDKTKGHRRNRCGSCITTKRRKSIKEKAVLSKGGKCMACGYSKYLGALDFHHRDERTKSFTIATAYNMSWDKISLELEKCDLLCSNCHREKHQKI